jgi:hypothetical protein
VDVGEEDGDFASGVEELGDLDGWYEVAAVRPSGRCRS